MKNIILSSLFLLPLIMFSCKKEAINNSANAIIVTAQDAADQTLKTAFINPSVNWIAATDHIGLYSDKAYTTAPGAYATNVDYIAQSTAATSTFSSATTVYWDGSTNVHNFYAYYPYASGTPAKTLVPISLPIALTQSGVTTDHIGPLDFEVATPLALTPYSGLGGANPSVSFTFNHVFTILKFDITCASANTLTSLRVTKGSGSSIALRTGSTIDISQVTPGAGVPYAIIAASGTAQRVITLTANLPITSTIASAYLLILPGDHIGSGNFDIRFTSEAGRNYTLQNKAGIYFERGKVYTTTVSIPITGTNAWR